MDKMSAPPATGDAVTAANVDVAAAAGDTVTDNPELLLIGPSATTMLAVSAFLRTMTPLLPPDTVATPLENVIVVTEPKFVSFLVLLLPVRTLPLFPYTTLFQSRLLSPL